MKIIISPRAEKEFKKISKIDQLILARKIRAIKSTPSTSKIEKLTGYKNVFRVRVGQYRIVYRKKINEIYIILIGHRKDIYRILKQLFK